MPPSTASAPSSVAAAACRAASRPATRGSARVAAPGQLKVKFVEWLPFEGDYWVLDVTDDYDVAVVGEPSGDFGWILARTPQIAPAALEAARAVLREDGYDVARLTYTIQPGEERP